ncbi:MAG TPA: hypothetical protein VME92_02120 [Acetobacteraceae bacterium]|nr:hypothetical protein [Acetobacteraceae bacterium]
MTETPKLEALPAPLSLTPDQIAAVAGGTALALTVIALKPIICGGYPIGPIYGGGVPSLSGLGPVAGGGIAVE